MLNSDKLILLTKKFSLLKLAFYNPGEYIYNYFSDLRNEVDLAANLELANNEELIEENENCFTDNWIDIIDRIKQFERECLHASSLSNSFINVKTHKAVDLIQKKINDLGNQSVKSELIQEFEQIIDNEINKIEKILLCNKSIIFLDKEKCELKQLFSKMNLNLTIGKLLFVKNEYFSKQSMETLKK